MKKILVVDDDPAILEAVTLILEEYGYIALSFNTTHHLEDILRSQKPDVVILDNLIAGKTGAEACRQIKATEDLKHIPIILFSAGRRLDELAKKACADGHIEKPFDIDALLSLVEKYI